MWALIVVGVVAVGWGLLAAPLQARHLRVPVVLTVAGLITGAFTHGELADTLNADLTTHVAEITLAVLLFVDATEVRRGRLFGQDGALAARLLVIALPVSLALAVLLGLVLLPGFSWPLLLVLACAVVPIDFAAAESLVRDERVPLRVRDAINVESGYNDGIVSPVFGYALLLAGTVGGPYGSGEPFEEALRAALLALVCGVAIGTALGRALTLSDTRGWSTAQSARLLIVLLPVVTYAIAAAVGGNGFVAAFVCGIAFRYARLGQPSAAPSRDHDAENALLEDLTVLLTVAMWFVFGNVAVLVITSGYVDLATVVYCVLVLTVVRAVPVLAALHRSRPTRTEQHLIA